MFLPLPFESWHDESDTNAMLVKITGLLIRCLVYISLKWNELSSRIFSAAVYDLNKPRYCPYMKCNNHNIFQFQSLMLSWYTFKILKMQIVVASKLDYAFFNNSFELFLALFINGWIFSCVHLICFLSILINLISPFCIIVDGFCFNTCCIRCIEKKFLNILEINFYGFPLSLEDIYLRETLVLNQLLKPVL